MFDLKKDYPKAYKKALSLRPLPDFLEEVDYEDPTFKTKDGFIDIDKTRDAHNRNLAMIQAWNDQAVKNREWIGRTIQDGMGDGYAVYIVIRENKKSVRIKVCRGLGDDWVSRHWGEEATISKEEACSFFPFNISDLGKYKNDEDLPYDMKRMA